MTKNSQNVTKNSKIITSYNTKDSYQTYFNWIWFLFGCYVVMYIMTAINVALNGSDAANSTTFEYITYLLSPTLFFLLFCWQNRGKKYDIKQCLGLNNKLSIGNIIISIVIAVLSILCFSKITVIFDYSLSIIGFNPLDEVTLIYDNFGYLLLNLLLLAVLPAVCEELIFRGIILNGLKKEHSPAAAILISAALFTLMHGTLQQTLYQFILGTFLSILMYYTANIIYPIITHFLSNAFVIVASYIELKNTTGGSTSTAITGVTTIDLIVGFGLALIGIIAMYFVTRYYLRPKSANQTIIYKGKSIANYTMNERRYAIISISIAIILWLINTIYQFTV